jgi:hypothetical protein
MLFPTHATNFQMEASKNVGVLFIVFHFEKKDALQTTHVTCTHVFRRARSIDTYTYILARMLYCRGVFAATDTHCQV